MQIINKEKIVKIIDFWLNVSKKNNLVSRDLTKQIDCESKEIVDIVGVRRSGKSSVLKLLMKELNQNDNSLFINFEDPFFIENNKPEIIEDIIEIYKEYYQSNLKFLFFDEIQNIENWEKSIRKLRDSENYKIFLTGSSSKLLSKELSSLLTGRHISYQLMPLSFCEYLDFKKIKIEGKKDFILMGTKINKYFNNYLSLGGFPEVVLGNNEELLKQYYFDIINKDILRRYDVRQKNIFEKMGVYLFSNLAKPLSLSSLANIFDISFELASNYLEYFKESFLIFDLLQFSYSLKTQQKSFKKIYSIDTGLANNISFRFSDDRGRILENIVFLHLRKIFSELFYYKTKNNHEVDFLGKNGRKFTLIQVCADLNVEITKKREIKALLEAGKEMNISTGLILTENEKEIIKIDDFTITVKPIWEWLLGN